MTSHPSDPDLVRQCLAGHEQAWRTLIDRYGRLVYSIPRRLSLAESDADDVFQAVFTSLFRSLASLRDETRLSAWLITAAHREAWRQGRQGRRATDLDDAPASVEPDASNAERWERTDLVRRAVESLGEPCRTLLSALFLRSVTPEYQTVARELGMKVGSIGPTRARCFRRLEDVLREFGLTRDDLR